MDSRGLQLPPPPPPPPSYPPPLPPVGTDDGAGLEKGGSTGQQLPSMLRASVMRELDISSVEMASPAASSFPLPRPPVLQAINGGDHCMQRATTDDTSNGHSVTKTHTVGSVSDEWLPSLLHESCEQRQLTSDQPDPQQGRPQEAVRANASQTHHDPMFSALLKQLDIAHSQAVANLHAQIEQLRTPGLKLELCTPGLKPEPCTDAGRAEPSQGSVRDLNSGPPHPHAYESEAESMSYDSETKPNGGVHDDGWQDATAKFEDYRETPSTTPSARKSRRSVKLEEQVQVDSGSDIAVKIAIVSACDLRRSDWMIGELSTPYCVCEIVGKENSIFQTQWINRTLNPVWNHEQVMPEYEAGDAVRLSVFDKDWRKEDDLLGIIEFDSSQFSPNGIDGEFELSQTGKPPEEPSTVKIKIAVAAKPAKVDILGVWRKSAPKNNVDRMCSTLSTKGGAASRERRLFGDPDSGSESSGFLRTESAMRRNAACHWLAQRISRTRCTAISPDSAPRMVWDISGIFVLMIDLIWIPMQVFSPVDSAGIQGISWFTLVYWSLDVGWTLNTGYYGKGNVLIRHRCDIGIRYLKSGWLFFDMFLVGIEWAGVVQKYSGSENASASDNASAARAGRVARATRIIRLLRLMRLAKLRQLLFALQSLIDSEWLTIVFAVGKSMFMIVAINHFLAAMWFLVGDSCGADGWVKREGYDHQDYGVQYLAALQWSLSQFTPGASHLRPEAMGERIFGVLVLGLALIVATCFVSSITSTMNAVWSVNRYKDTQTFLLKKFLNQMLISRELGARVTRYIDCVVELRHKTVPISKVEYLKLLSGPLNVELHCALFQPYLLQHSFFIRLWETSKSTMRQLCSVAVQTESYAKNDTLFDRGGESKHMQFVTKGSLAYQFLAKKGKKTIKLDEGRWCCEQALWINWIHRGKMKGLSDFETISLHVGKFSDVLHTSSRGTFLLAREAAVQFAVRMQCYYAFDVSSITDIPPELMAVIMGNGEEEDNRDNEVRRAEELELELIDFSDSEDDDDDELAAHLTLEA